MPLHFEAAQRYTTDVFNATEGDLAGATDVGGDPFEGFTTDGVWVVGSWCPGCTDTMPSVLAVVDVQ